jgi:hypothetical protein
MSASLGEKPDREALERALFVRMMCIVRAVDRDCLFRWRRSPFGDPIWIAFFRTKKRAVFFTRDPSSGAFFFRTQNAIKEARSTAFCWSTTRIRFDTRERKKKRPDRSALGVFTLEEDIRSINECVANSHCFFLESVIRSVFSLSLSNDFFCLL